MFSITSLWLLRNQLCLLRFSKNSKFECFFWQSLSSIYPLFRLRCSYPESGWFFQKGSCFSHVVGHFPCVVQTSVVTTSSFGSNLLCTIVPVLVPNLHPGAGQLVLQKNLGKVLRIRCTSDKYRNSKLQENMCTHQFYSEPSIILGFKAYNWEQFLNEIIKKNLYFTGCRWEEVSKADSSKW